MTEETDETRSKDRADKDSSRKEKKKKSKKKKSRKREREGKNDEPPAKQAKLEPLTEEAKKDKLQKLKKLPKISRRRNAKKGNEAVQELRKLTKLKARHLKKKMVFIPKSKRKAMAEKDKHEKKMKAREKAEEEKRTQREQERKLRMQRDEERRTQRRQMEKERPEKRSDAAERRETGFKDQELQLIQEDYLGKKKKKKVVIPPSQKFKFNFDWDAGEDTSEMHNEIYKKRAKVSLLCGRGYMAGYDRDEQEKQNKQKWSRLVNRKPVIHKQEGALGETLKARRDARKKRQLLKDAERRSAHRHWTKKKLSEMTPRDWRIFNEDFRITTKFGGKLPLPIRFWGESGLPEKLMDAIEDAGYRKPYPIQRVAIPVGLMNRDCVGIAETGSGKTAAFVIPMIVYILKQPPMNSEIAGDGPYALILAPTRELADQIDRETKKFSKFLSVKSMVITGGVDIHMQSALAAHGVDIIIATPGRLLDSLQKRFLALNQCKYIVMDEADRMIDMGFAPDVEAIMERMPVSNERPLNDDDAEADKTYRQTFMFTATMSPEIQRLAKQYLRHHVVIQIGDPNERAAKNVSQHVIWTTDQQKRKRLQSLLDNESIVPPIMIFMNMKKACETLVRFLREQNYNAEALHGGRIQEQRKAALKRFHDGLVDILVCTDVAGRGIDVKGVKAVVNYDMAHDVMAYCHRVGRTGRAEEKGDAFTFLTEHDSDTFYELRQLLLNGGHSIPRELDRHPAARVKGAVARPSGPKVIYAH